MAWKDTLHVRNAWALSCPAARRLRRTEAPAMTDLDRDTKVQCGPVLIDRQRYAVQVHEEEVALTRMQFDLLDYLVRNADRVVAPSEIMRHVMRATQPLDNGGVRVHICLLRKKLGTAARHIQTVRGRGLLFRIDA
jgi:DNA-binding response OmpR family regulator